MLVLLLVIIIVQCSLRCLIAKFWSPQRRCPFCGGNHVGCL